MFGRPYCSTQALRQPKADCFGSLVVRDTLNKYLLVGEGVHSTSVTRTGASAPHLVRGSLGIHRFELLQKSDGEERQKNSRNQCQVSVCKYLFADTEV